MLYPVHRPGAKPAAGRFRASTLISTILTPLVLILASPLAAHAADTPEPLHKFGDRTLTDDGDVITNETTLDLTQDIDFGGGDDAVTNTGTITIGAKATGPTLVTLKSLEGLKNDGLIDLRNGHVGDVLTISGNYNGTSKARLGLDVGPDGADRLVAGATVNGKTAVVLGVLSAKTAVLTGDKGPVLIQGGAGSTADAFTVENSEIGFVHYSLVFDAQALTYRLNGVAGQHAYESLKISEGASNVWRQSADAWSAHVANVRDTESQGGGVWGQAFGGRQDRDDDIAVAGRAVSTDYRQTTYGGQMGVDLINGDLGEGHILLGVTGGYADAKLRFESVGGQDVKLKVANVGAYAALSRGGFFLNALAKADRQSIDARGGTDGLDAGFDGKSFGAQVEAGHRMADEGAAFEQLLSVSYVSTKLDDMEAAGQRLDFGDATGFVAKIGVRGSARSDFFGGALTSYGAAFLAHDFTVKNSLTLASGGQSERLSTDGGRTFGQMAVGLSVRASQFLTTYVEANGDYGGGRKGGGLRVGARFGF